MTSKFSTGSAGARPPSPLKSAGLVLDETRCAQIAAATDTACQRFTEEFNRHPTPREVHMIAMAIARHLAAPNAPTTRLQ